MSHTHTHISGDASEEHTVTRRGGANKGDTVRDPVDEREKERGGPERVAARGGRPITVSPLGEDRQTQALTHTHHPNGDAGGLDGRGIQQDTRQSDEEGDQLGVTLRGVHLN